MKPTQRLARTAGLYYLVVAVLGAFAHIVRGIVYVPGDATTTAARVVENVALVRYSVAADLVQATFLVFVVLALHRLLHHVDARVARAMVLFVVIAVAMITLNMVHQFGALLVATEPSYAAALGADGADSLVMLLMDLQHYGYLAAQIFFGLWLFPLGLLAWRSGMFPRAIAAVLIAASTGYLVDVLLQFLAPTAADLVNPALVSLFVLAEGSLLVFLLAKGVLNRQPAERFLVDA
ncbi:DUF4386 domain-containing protein [Cellulomonas sp. ATA003]|uniref:DUF4386 domain-containing protein n=1 Tax=Cellulomonas sp. ATA003 TaxID=3073064 RepID=UPI00287362D1|nr:DUF4386 domain-containing protein [Cellulomonas sp. ATA003]WNB85856.1 DUF4386 domain-containing protein [Cellulomonas sp. ATA003]